MYRIPGNHVFIGFPEDGFTTVNFIHAF